MRQSHQFASGIIASNKKTQYSTSASAREGQ